MVGTLSSLAVGFVGGALVGKAAAALWRDYMAFNAELGKLADDVDSIMAEQERRHAAQAAGKPHALITPGYDQAPIDLAELGEWAQQNTSADLFAERRRFREVVALVDWARRMTVRHTYPPQ